MDIVPINQKRIYQSIIEQFVGLINSGKLQIGEKMPPERTLAEMFNVSRASIREALSALEIIGLVEVRPGEGSFVTELNIAPFLNAVTPLFIRNETMEKDLLDFRKILELNAVELAAVRAESTKDLLTALKDMKVAIDKNDLNAGAEADFFFHKSIFTLSRNFILIKASECISTILENSVRFNRGKILKNSHNAYELYNQHLGIYEAIMLHRPEMAKKRMEKHLNFVLEIS
jgi:GntR family transcriptional repressor for pyruvate dehydrogenase complex